VSLVRTARGAAGAPLTKATFRSKVLVAQVNYLQVSMGYWLEPPIPMKYFSPRLQRATHFGISALQIAIAPACFAGSGTLLRAQLLHSPLCSEHDRAEAGLETIEVSTPRITVTNIPKVEIFISVSPISFF
jgi:hypothetical protein